MSAAEPEQAGDAEPSVDGERRERRRGHATLLVVQVFFGLFPLFIKLALESFEPLAIVFWRVVTGALVLGGLAAAVHGRRAWPLARDLPALAACALLGVVLNQTLAVEGIALSSATEAGLLMTLIPVFTFAFAILFKKERFRWRRAAGIGLALAGALLLLTGSGTADLAREHLVGNLLIVVNCASYALYLVLSGPLLTRYPPLVVIAWVYVLSLGALPLLLGRADVLPAAPSASALSGLAYVLVFSTVVTYLLNLYALARVRAATTAVYVYLQPLVAGAAGVAILGETLPPAAPLAATCLFAGIALVAAREPLARPRYTGRLASARARWTAPPRR